MEEREEGADAVDGGRILQGFDVTSLQLEEEKSMRDFKNESHLKTTSA